MPGIKAKHFFSLWNRVQRLHFIDALEQINNTKNKAAIICLYGAARKLATAGTV